EEKSEQPKVYESVMKGNRNGILDHVNAALAKGYTPSSIINEMLIPAIHEVGELFDKQIYFLPQLISSAEVMKKAIEYLEPMLEQDED
ncbi:B12-binding domain-containing protein, partial [Pseudomonas aeruginosa]|nr:B12-binding domain-containing protein [Pseudomonas aeruginosa]